jgi:hypothetical protein
VADKVVRLIRRVKPWRQPEVSNAFASGALAAVSTAKFMMTAMACGPHVSPVSEKLSARLKARFYR